MDKANKGFTLIELLTVIVIVGIFISLLGPAISKGRAAGKRSVCASNLRQMHAALTMYYQDHKDEFFNSFERIPGSSDKLFYWGLKTTDSSGRPTINRQRGKLAPYLAKARPVESCPSLPVKASYFRPQFGSVNAIAGDGYGINTFLLKDRVAAMGLPITRYHQIVKPNKIVMWGDAIALQQSGPNRGNLQDTDELRTDRIKNYHFRHGGRFNAVLGDGSVKSLKPRRLLSQADGLVGDLEDGASDSYLRTDG